MFRETQGPIDELIIIKDLGDGLGTIEIHFILEIPVIWHHHIILPVQEHYGTRLACEYRFSGIGEYRSGKSHYSGIVEPLWQNGRHRSPVTHLVLGLKNGYGPGRTTGKNHVTGVYSVFSAIFKKPRRRGNKVFSGDFHGLLQGYSQFIPNSPAAFHIQSVID